ncbi:hypothetical protein OEZ86_000572 [Tetradesmus obliquus]|nr:hypothetical protein OEZ86_000572 [Tetradesmus obliquus]
MGPMSEEPQSGCSPSQVHIALGRDATEMHVSWKTADANCPSEVTFRQAGSGDGQQLQAGAPGVSNAVGYSFLLSERDMCSEPAASNEFMLYLHRAKMTNLAPSSEYEYQVAGSSTLRRLRSGVEPHPEHSFTFLAFGDMGDAVHAAAKSPGAADTLARLQQEVDAEEDPASLILHVGDISYANGDPDIWDSFMDGIQPIASRVPYMVAIGNHEYGYRKGSGAMVDPSGAAGPYQPSWGNFGPDSRGECGVMTARRFHMPQHPSQDDLEQPAPGTPAGANADAGGNAVGDVRPNAPFWYSFDYGSVHFTVISTENDLSPSSSQYAWLEKDLSAVDRCATPWLVVLLHRPLYVVYPHKSNREVGAHLRASIEDLLQQHRVDLTVAGHVHSYYRTCPVYDEACIPGFDQGSGDGDDYFYHSSSSSSRRSGSRGGSEYGCDGDGNCKHGIVHFTIGSAGHKLSEVERGQEEWLAASVQRYGFGRFRVEGSDRLVAEYVGSESGRVLDSVEVRATAERQAMCRKE